jgi:hypothetical protein
MSLKIPVTKRIIRNHFQYGFWKYLLLIVIALFGWNLIYTTTRYRPPENKKVEFIGQAVSMEGLSVQTLADTIHAEVMPEMEEVTASSVTYDDTYGDMQLIVWVSAGQGDVYLLSKDRYTSLSEQESLMDLTPYVASGALQTEGIDLTGGYGKNAETGASELLGIPADSLTGLSDYGLLTADGVLCVLVNNGNDDYSVAFLNYLLTHMRAETAGDTAVPSVTSAP